MTEEYQSIDPDQITGFEFVEEDSAEPGIHHIQIVVLSQILVEVAKSRRSCIIKQPNHRTVRLLFEERRFRPPFALF